jgi:hypothetical protein
MIAKKKMTIVDAIDMLRADSSKNWQRYTKQNLVTRYREARRERKKHRHLTSELTKSGLIAGVGQIRYLKSESGRIAGVGKIRDDEK